MCLVHLWTLDQMKAILKFEGDLSSQTIPIFMLVLFFFWEIPHIESAKTEKHKMQKWKWKRIRWENFYFWLKSTREMVHELCISARSSLPLRSNYRRIVLISLRFCLRLFHRNCFITNCSSGRRVRQNRVSTLHIIIIIVIIMTTTSSWAVVAAVWRVTIVANGYAMLIISMARRRIEMRESDRMRPRATLAICESRN